MSAGISTSLRWLLSSLIDDYTLCRTSRKPRCNVYTLDAMSAARSTRRCCPSTRRHLVSSQIHYGARRRRSVRRGPAAGRPTNVAGRQVITGARGSATRPGDLARRRGCCCCCCWRRRAFQKRRRRRIVIDEIGVSSAAGHPAPTSSCTRRR